MKAADDVLDAAWRIAIAEAVSLASGCAGRRAIGSVVRACNALDGMRRRCRTNRFTVALGGDRHRPSEQLADPHSRSAERRPHPVDAASRVRLQWTRRRAGRSITRRCKRGHVRSVGISPDRRLLDAVDDQGRFPDGNRCHGYVPASRRDQQSSALRLL